MNTSEPVPTLTSRLLIWTLISDAFEDFDEPPFDNIPAFITVPKSNENSIDNDGIWDSAVIVPTGQRVQSDEPPSE